MARKPVPQPVSQHVEATPSAQAIMIEDIKFPIIDYETPSLPITPQYRSFPGPHNNSSSDTFLEVRKMSNGQIKTGTSELAEFLKSSKPGDFGSSAVTGSVDDLSLSGSSHQKKRRFLRSLTPRDGVGKNRTQPPLPFRPPHVTPKLTSKGSHYLQIQVDYRNISNQAEQPFSEIVASAVPRPILGNTNISSQKWVTEGDVAGTTQLTQPHISMLPPPWSPPESKPPTVDGVNAYQGFLRTEPTNTKRRTPVLPPLKTDFGGPQARIPQIQYHIPRTLHTPTREVEIGSVDAGSYSSSAPQCLPKGSHGPATSQGVSIRQSATIDHMAPQSDHSQLRILPKPGPPPSRALPSLPERPVFPHQVALCSVSPLPLSPIEKDEAHVNVRKRREDQVKVRKAKDMKLLQQRKLQEAIRLLDADAETKGKACHGLPTVSPVSPVSPISTTGLPTERRNSQTPPVNNTNSATATSSTLEPPKGNHLQLLTHDAPTPPRSPSSLLHPTISVRSGAKSSQASCQTVPEANLRGLLEEAMTRQIELEDRIESMEHKYMVLEQALITVLQRTSPHRSESNSIENLLAGFRLTRSC
ncbi:hypothetical protein L211DRAFT_846351 [Terfezia boudieri ATCC MYA-4762]|uniref:Uncharacterized protein n=1 Tax=Terfezia boudieri ATCC MYA-4762 TaxID=1051890 RepID=A0A3N4LXF3_9PEZI|nr:hypothetical protein L211DRAFT_846351 [Terfezia boudieri ATCC MYA-4762]